MYKYIKGILEEINIDYIVVECSGIGYKINTSQNTICDIKKGEEVKVYTKLVVREDDMSIYGFKTKEELKMYELLNSVSKIGPKVALGILSFAEPKKLGAYILSEDVSALSKAPGVGKKTAERLVLELKDKIDKNNVEFEPTLLTNINKVPLKTEEAVQALVALGYSLAESKEAVNKCKKNCFETEELIKKCLAYLMK
ncbi:Holliday junction branch migration protein RuvA [Tepidibacter formicigenes]|jgi:Holliday junction DNA helicase RuvA|uniref:Holliday junction branch migration complex subunit RuvA n=1 Tax=Tepidibacter formicigenes DSM 15518 TaxID=1123349 RepID=A0A1M6MWK8_9FIRM|nr:Holliday junction branch migration protein RuvA [Tepidibacter formicigenes]SHJ87867.1 Holliday junction DNA helicase subunit RuvA [Tepidibacter formicigenes DSM 15518]